MGLDLGSITGGILGDTASTAAQYFANRDLQQRANDYTSTMMQNKHQWEVQDLRKAGLNPILSARGATPIGTSASASISRPPNTYLTALEANAKREALNAAKSKAQAEESGADVDTMINRIKQKLLQNPLGAAALMFPAASAAGVYAAVRGVKKIAGTKGIKPAPYKGAPRLSPALARGSYSAMGASPWVPGSGVIGLALALGAASMYGNSRMDKSSTNYNPWPFGTFYRPY